jgi:hypothetical protein
MDILTHVNKKRHLWIGLGWIKKKPAGSFNPATQSTFFKTPPRLPKSSHALLQKSRSMMLAVLDLYHQDIVKNKQADDDDDKNNNLEVNKGNDRDKMDKNLCNLAPVILEQISNEDKSTDPVEAIEGLLKTIRASQDAKQKVRLSLVLGGVKKNHLEEEGYEIRKSSFPILLMVGLPVTKPLVSSLLREIVVLSSFFPDHGLLSYEMHRESLCELVKIIWSNNKKSFVTNVQRHQSWLHCLPSLVVPESVDPSVGTSWVLQHLALNFEDEFVHMCKKMGYPIFSKNMDTATACAMWQEVNVSKKRKRMILR